MRPAIAALAATLLATVVLAAPIATAAREPLLVPGKTDLYQRVLSRPDAVIVDKPAGTTRVEVPPVFTSYYVFDRQTADGREWLEVGPSASRAPAGWVGGDQTVAWATTIVLSFTNLDGRLPVLFFDDRDSLMGLVESESLAARAPVLAAAARRGAPPADSGIVSIEPHPPVDMRERFYLLPILETDEVFVTDGPRAQIVKIASIPADDAAPAPDRIVDEDYRVGVMFVIDTTSSMADYIARTRQTVERVFRRIEQSGVGDRVSFGMVAFRDKLDRVPELEYLTDVVAPLEIPPNHAAFLARLDDVEVARASSIGFNEDGLAGVMAAIDRDDWKNFGGRYIIYMSDAGMRSGEDSSTGLTPRIVGVRAREKLIAVVSLLLATPLGKDHHEKAESQLVDVSFWGESSIPVFRVPNGDLREFGVTIDDLADRIIADVERATGTEGASGSSIDDAPAGCEGRAARGSREALGDSVDCILYAQRLAWLGRVRGSSAPSVFEAWAPDFALDAPTRKAFDVRVLLTKQQLSRMATALKWVLEAGREIDSNPERFFDQLRSVVARATRDPDGLDSGGTGVRPDSDRIDNLGDLLGEYLNDLPYESQLIEISEDRWRNMGPAAQDRIVTAVRSKLRAYQHFHDDADSWVRLHPDATDDERVYPIPLELLP